jgi:hypothetical protein
MPQSQGLSSSTTTITSVKHNKKYKKEVSLYTGRWLGRNNEQLTDGGPDLEELENPQQTDEIGYEC